jgi:hypothetical protein
MNITRLNTLNDDKVIIKKEGNGGATSGGGSSEGSKNAEELIFIAMSNDLSAPADPGIATGAVVLPQILPSQVLLIKCLAQDGKAIGVITASDTDPSGNFMPSSSVSIGSVIKKGTIISLPEFGIETTLNSYDDVCAFIQENVAPDTSMDVIKASIKNLTYEQVMSIIRTGNY